MAIQLEKDKCIVRNPDSLRIKRYLSNTRSYFREGLWIREFFQSFFPCIKTDPTGNLYYDFQTLEPVFECCLGANLGETKIPAELIEQLQKSIDAYIAHLGQQGLSFNEEVASREFTVPDPEMHPDLYWVVTDKVEVRLIILWGLESEASDSNIPIEYLASKLYESFQGAVALKDISGDSSYNKKRPKPPPKASAKSLASKPGKTAKSAVRSSKKAKPPPKKKRSIRIFYRVVCLALLLLAFTIASVCYLGPSLQVEKVAIDSSRNQGCVVDLQPGQQLKMAEGTLVVPATDESHSIVFDRFPKPGSFDFEVLDTINPQKARTITHRYHNVYQDMALTPVASFLVNTGKLNEKGIVRIYPSLSFHEALAESENLSYRILWGDNEVPFKEIQRSEFPLTYQYETFGEHTITLLVMDSDSAWDRDRVTLQYAEDCSAGPKVFNQAPVPDVEIAGIYSTGDFHEVILDVSNSYDIDGTLQAILIDWGDGTDPIRIEPPFSYIAHKYKRNHNRVSVTVETQDSLGKFSERPAIAFLDFQSQQMNRTQSKREELLKEKPTRQLFRNEIEGIGIEAINTNLLHKHRKEIIFALRNPIHMPFTALHEVQWKVTGPEGNTFTIEDTPRIRLLGSEGKYFITLTAKTMDGEPLVCEQHYILSLHGQLNPLMRLLFWWSQQIPHREQIYKLCNLNGLDSGVPGN